MKNFFLACLLSAALLGEPTQKTNCKLTIKTTLKDNSENVEIKEVNVADKAACHKLMTKAQKFTDEAIKQVNVEMSFTKLLSP